MFGLAIEGEPSRFTTPQMGLPLRATGAEKRSVR